MGGSREVVSLLKFTVDRANLMQVVSARLSFNGFCRCCCWMTGSESNVLISDRKEDLCGCGSTQLSSGIFSQISSANAAGTAKIPVEPCSIMILVRPLSLPYWRCSSNGEI